MTTSDVTEFEKVYLRCAELAEAELLSCLQLKESKFRLKFHGVNKGKGTNLVAQVGDVVKICENQDTPRLGVIEKLQSDNTAVLRTSRGQVKRLTTGLQIVSCLRRDNRYYLELLGLIQIIIFVSDKALYLNMDLIWFYFQAANGKLEYQGLMDADCIYDIVYKLKVKIHNFNYKAITLSVLKLAWIYGVIQKQVFASNFMERRSRVDTGSAAQSTLGYRGERMKYQTTLALIKMVIPVAVYLVTVIVVGSNAGDTPFGGSTKIDFWWKRPNLREDSTYQSGGVKYLTADFIDHYFSRAMLEITEKLKAERSNTASNTSLLYLVCAFLGVAVIGLTAGTIATYKHRRAAAADQEIQKARFQKVFEAYNRGQFNLEGAQFHRQNQAVDLIGQARRQNAAEGMMGDI